MAAPEIKVTFNTGDGSTFEHVCNVFQTTPDDTEHLILQMHLLDDKDRVLHSYIVAGVTSVEAQYIYPDTKAN